jgi:predicted enzyme related to lactoylglutathione lyase
MENVMRYSIDIPKRTRTLRPIYNKNDLSINITTMKTNLILMTSFLLGISFTSCDNMTNKESSIQHQDTLTTDKSNNIKSYISIFEIPATDISRAIDFYQAILDIKIEKMDMPDMQMGILPYEKQIVTGVIIKADGYKPSTVGLTIYLNGGNNLQFILDKVEKSGGRILIPKTRHADESGYFATFIDSEGNKIGLHSPN